MAAKSGSGPVCAVCEGQDYVLSNGYYYCRLCSTQSQELGVEKVMDEDHLLTLGMRATSITIQGEKSLWCTGRHIV
jgi:hypothetical protein